MQATKATLVVMDGRFEQIDKRFEQVESRIEKLHEEVRDLKEDLREVRSYVFTGYMAGKEFPSAVREGRSPGGRKTAAYDK